MADRVEIGIVCWQGHYAFTADPEGINCGKVAGRIFVEWESDPYFGGGTAEELIAYCEASLGEKIAAWRRG